MMYRFYLRFFCFLLFIISGNKISSAQDVAYSLPEKLQYGVTRFEILGRNTQGIVMQLSSRSQTTMEVYTTDMKLKWKKNLALKEIGATVQQIFLLGDSSLVFYSHFVKGKSVLKVMKVNDRFEFSGRQIILDSVTVYSYADPPDYSFTLSGDKSKYMVYYTEGHEKPKKKIHAVVLDKSLNVISNRTFRIQSADQPDLLTALVDDSAKTYFLTADNQVRNFRNNYPYLTLQLYYFSDSADNFLFRSFYADGKLLTAPVVRPDWENHRIIVAGLYALNPGVESQGVYYLSYAIPDCELLQSKFSDFPAELLSSLTGNTPPRRTDGFFNLKPQEMIVKKDGGAIFFTEAISLSSESFAAPGYGGFGISSSLTVNYYHYDNIVTTGFTPDGGIEWQKIYPKKQQTEGDEGYYSSFGIYIGTNSLSLLYNDFISGMTNFASYKINIDGTAGRAEIFNADKKGVLPISRFGKQISSREFIVPSIKRGYLQFVKITF